MLDTYNPWTPHAIAHDAAVTACTYYGFADAALPDDIDSTINCIALRNAAKIDPHRGVVETDLVVGKLYMMIVDCGKFLRYRLIAGLLTLAVIVGIADAGVGDIESTRRNIGKID